MNPLFLETESKVCSLCKEEKPISDFYLTTQRGKPYRVARCDPCYKTKAKEARDKNPNYFIEWYYKNKEKAAIITTRYRQKHSEKINQKQTVYRAKNLDKFREYGRQWYAKNTLKCLAKTQNRRSIKKTTGDGSVTSQTLKDLMEQQNWKCSVSEMNLRETQYHLDHIWPISKQGEHKLNNLQFITAKLNHQKSDNIPWEYCFQIPSGWV